MKTNQDQGMDAPAAASAAEEAVRQEDEPGWPRETRGHEESNEARSPADLCQCSVATRKSRIRRTFLGRLSVIWIAIAMPMLGLFGMLLTKPTWDGVREFARTTAVTLFFAYVLLVIFEGEDD